MWLEPPSQPIASCCIGGPGLQTQCCLSVTWCQQRWECLQDAELAVTLLYELGEGASEEAMKPGTGALAQLAQGEQLRHCAVCGWAALFCSGASAPSPVS